MQSDEVVWQIINHGHCSFKLITPSTNFCKNRYNVTGLCNRSSCPLSNSQYATVLEENGRIFLYLKSVERAHLPNKLWESFELDSRYEHALKQINSNLNYWPKFFIHKSKQRLTKLTQLLIRTKKIAKNERGKIVQVPSRESKRETRREIKAEVAARIEKSIEDGLLERLRHGTYNFNYAIPFSEYKTVFDQENLSVPQIMKKDYDSKRKRLEIEYEKDTNR
jgi:protein MAK16